MNNINTSKRYCNIRATNLQELLDAVNRNIANTYLMQVDMITEGDISTLDDFYCKMLIGILQDMREDIKGIITKEQNANAAK